MTSLLVTGLGLASLSGQSVLPPAFAQSATVIPGKQCIYNNGAFSLKVEWYDPGIVVFKGKSPAEYTDWSKYEITGRPVEIKDNVTLGVSSCTEGANRVAVVRIVGHKIANNAITIAAGTGTGIVTGVAGAFACVGTGGAACPAAAAAVGAAAPGVVSVVTSALPDVQEIAYIGSPGTRNYVDLSGTIWQVGVANNIPLTDSRGFSRVATFFTGGDPGPKSISFSNQAGYVAEMTVIYSQKMPLPGFPPGPSVPIVDFPIFKSSGKISVGRTVHIDVPLAINNQPITVIIEGVATVKSRVFQTTVPANFSGNRCYKAYGTIFDPQGSTC
ncbi:MAG: hypothetical protein IGQ88_02790 [Gloeomargaritaceae cyanobacterium C42_A2020_066]|nr:hypothetical protein [Gloeomargaritaceae cyanobacterium C42_A2020_066]